MSARMPSLVRAAAAVACAILAGCRQGGAAAQHRVVGGDAARGKARIVAYGCGSCHVIPGVPAATGRVDLLLTDVADRAYVAGALRNEPATLVRWIRTPQALQPGTAMPDLGVSEPDARDIAAYLYTRTGDRLGPAHLIPVHLLPGH